MVVCKQGAVAVWEGLVHLLFHTYVSPKQLIAWSYYAYNQTDCAPQSEFDFTQPCKTWIEDLFQLCDRPMEFKEFIGGGYVRKGPEGCIEYYIGKAVAV